MSQHDVAQTQGISEKQAKTMREAGNAEAANDLESQIASIEVCLAARAVAPV